MRELLIIGGYIAIGMLAAAVASYVSIRIGDGPLGDDAFPIGMFWPFIAAIGALYVLLYLPGRYVIRCGERMAERARLAEKERRTLLAEIERELSR